MSRTITAKRRTTPTFIYNISDTQASGINLDDLNIGMTIVIGKGDSTTEPTIYILSSNDNSDIFNLAERDDPAVSPRLFVDPSYCGHIAKTNSFFITIPLWKLSSTVKSDGIFQVFLYGEKTISGGGARAVPGEVDELITETISFHNIVIDEGTFTLEESLVPEIEGQAKRDGLNRVYI